MIADKKQENYVALELECQAIVFACCKFRPVNVLKENCGGDSSWSCTVDGTNCQ